MIPARLRSWILGVAILVVLASRSMVAIGPAFIVLHGGSLQTPIVLRPAIGSLMFMWAAGFGFYDNRQDTKIPNGLDGRRYLDYDVFWGRFTPDEVLTPELASQHGRLYLATKDQAAVVVLTAPDMDGGPGATRAQARPVPSHLDGYVYRRALASSETAGLVAAGIAIP